MDPPTDHDAPAHDSRRAAVVGLIVIVVLAALAVVLVRELGKESKLEDCLMAGRRNCMPIETPARQ